MEILPQLLVNALIAGSIYALASSGLSLVYGILRVLNFAHGHLMMCGAYFFYLAYVEYEWSIFPASVVTLVMMLLLAAFCLRVFVLPFSRFSFILTFVTTLALSNILEAAISMYFGVNVKSLSPGSAAESIEIHGVYITPIQIIIIASALLFMSLLAIFIHTTSVGRKIRALSEDAEAAQSMAINKTALSYFVFILGALLAAYAGVLVGFETNMQPTMGTAYTIKAFAAMILGGLGNLWGTIAGSYILGLVENLSIGLDFGGYSIPAGYKDAFSFMIILLVLLFKPQGLFLKRKRTA
jgi:branched-subunit amino acid ABC-type transport system permease component